ncbi:GerAB/ArcD/ProY family transporter [Neobacillus sp. LXY-4]|uniref:GerAB/ArcD/ProY family transporter n=1 Tax=Neobacillus sp. LXY-4 TaxID=3379826 RepID=UPI003EE0AA96
MLENGKISQNQFTVLVTMYLIGSSILLLPSAFAGRAKQDAWLAAILGVAIGTLLVFLYNTIGNSFSNMTLAEYSEKILGKWLGKSVSIIFFSYFFLISALVLRNIGDFLVTHILADTPIQFIEAIFLIIVIFGVHLGLETFSRTSEFLFPWVLFLLFLLIIFISPQVKFENMLPVFEGGIKPIIFGSLPYIGTPSMELVVFLMIIPFVQETKFTKKAFFSGYMIGGIVLIIISFLSVLVLGAGITAIEIYPTFLLATKINIGDFLQRIEAMLAIVWFITIFFKLVICFYASSLCLAQTLKLKDYRFLLIPLGLSMMVLSLVAYPNSAYFLSVIGSIWFPYSILYGIILPVLLLTVGKIRKIKTNNKG